MKTFKVILLIIFSLILTLFFSIYQRITGPTHPVKVKLKFMEKEYNIKLIRSSNTGKDVQILLPIENNIIKADLFFKNLTQENGWEKREFERKKENLVSTLKSLPPAGKYLYYIKIYFQDVSLQIPEKPISIRFKNKVPDLVLISHILIIFSGFLISIYTGLYSIAFGASKKLTLITFILFLVGAGVLGPIVQYYAFGQFWTGFPLGKDLTDNKGLILVIFWGLAYFKIKNGKGKEWILLAFFISVLVFFIPHSLWGSELKGGKIKTGP